jgi:glycosyltransferase involved in cell wall biosynthesis
VDGYLFDPNAPIQQAIDLTIKLLREKQEIDAMRSNARKKAEQMGWSAAVRQLQEYYQRTLN